MQIGITYKKRLLLKPGPRLDQDPEKPGPRYWTQALKKPGRRKIWTLQNMDPGKHEINMGLKNLSDFRKLCFIKTIAI